MNQEEKEKCALWRYGQISPAIYQSHPFKNNSEFFRHLSTQPMIHPVTGKEKFYSARTYAYWFHRYQNMGMDGLLPGDRKDRGLFRALTPQIQLKIDELLDEFPRIKNTRLRKKLKEAGVIDDSLSQSTIDRYVRTRSHEKKLPEIHSNKDRKAFEFKHANECWQADTTELHRIGNQRVFLMLILDDASRMVVGYGFFYHDNAVNFIQVLKKAVSTYGVPQKLYMDNGAPYENHQLQMICAKAGIQYAHAPVRDGAAKGKIERLNQTLKTDWLEAVHWKDFVDLEDAERSFHEYLYPEYINKPHSALEGRQKECFSPRERFLKDSERIRMLSPEQIQEIFVCRYERKVKTDSTIQIQHVVYEVPSEYMKEKLTVCLDPSNTALAWMEDPQTHERIQIRKVDKVENSRVPRKHRIQFPEEKEKDS